MSCPSAVPAAVAALASMLAEGLSDNEVALLSALFVQLGDCLTSVLALRACQSSGDNPGAGL